MVYIQRGFCIQGRGVCIHGRGSASMGGGLHPERLVCIQRGSASRGGVCIQGVGQRDMVNERAVRILLECILVVCFSPD